MDFGEPLPELRNTSERDFFNVVVGAESDNEKFDGAILLTDVFFFRADEMDSANTSGWLAIVIFGE